MYAGNNQEVHCEPLEVIREVSKDTYLGNAYFL
jgi:hypothetical protein